jgi:hypothetical protein
MALISDTQRRAIAQRYARLTRPEGHELPSADWPEEAWRSALAMDWVKFVRTVGPCISGPMRPANLAQWRTFCAYLDGWRRSFSRYIPHAEELEKAGQPALRVRLDQILQQLEGTARITHPSATPTRPVRAVVPGSKLPPLVPGGTSKPVTAAPGTQPRVRAVVPGSKLPPLAPGGASKPATTAPRMQAPQPAPASRPPPPAPAKAPARPAPQPSKIDAEIAAYLAKANAEIRAIQSGLTQDRIDAGQKTLNTMSAASNAMDAMTAASHARLAAQMDRRSDAEWAWRLAWGRKPLRNR